MRQPILSKFCPILLLLVTACSGSSTPDDDPDEPERRGQQVNPVELTLLDKDPALSADGSRVVFLSGRDDVLRVLKYQTGSAEPSRLTDVDLGSETEVEINPDGNMVAFSATADGVTELYVQSFSDAAVRTKVAEEAGSWDFAPVLSPGTNPYLIFKQRSEESGRLFDLVGSEITDAGTSLTASAVTAVPETTATEDNPRFRIAGAGYELVTMRRDGETYEVVSRDVTSGTVSATAIVLGSGFSGIRPTTFDVAQTQVYAGYHFPEKEERTVVLTDIDDNNTAVFTQEQPVALAVTGATPPELELPIIGIQDISAARDSDHVIVLGQEYVDCENFSGWGSTMSLWNPATSSFVKLVLVKTEETWTLQTDACSAVEKDAKQQPINLQISKARLASHTSSNFNVVVQSWYDGDPEILHLSFGLNGTDLTTPVVTDVSANTAE
jgi:hypothetical protein